MEKVKAMIEGQIERAGEIGNFKKVMEMEILMQMVDDQLLEMTEVLNLTMKIHANS